MQQVFDMAIIGGGPAGYTAALYAARAGLNAVVIEKATVGGQMSYAGIIENYPGFEKGIDGFALGEKMQECAQRFDAKTIYGKVISVELSKTVKRLKTDFGLILAKTVVIAAGADPRRLGVGNEAELIGRGVHYCAHCDGRFYTDKTVIVVGGGNTAVQEALYLSGLAKKVYIVHRRDTFKADKVNYEPLTKAHNVEFILNGKLAGFMGEQKLKGVKIENVKTGKISELGCDGIFAAIGRTPATGFLGTELLLDSEGYIVADESTRTNLSGVFAAGDIRTKKVRQIVTAVADGAVAAYFAEEYLSSNK